MVDGTDIIEEEFLDEKGQRVIKVNLTIRDIILFRLLKKIADGVHKHG